MKYITINPGFDQHLNLEPGEEYKLTMDVPIYNGGEVVRTTVNIKIPDASKVGALSNERNAYLVDPDIPKTILCPHCGYVYLPDRGIHSVVTKVQPDTIFKPFDQKYSAVYYDAWDCPRCGGQFVGPERAPRCK